MAGAKSITIAVTDCARHGRCAVDGQFWRHFDRRREDLWQSAVAGTINRIDCAGCGRRFDPPEAFLYSDTAREIAMIVGPDAKAGEVAPGDFVEHLLAIEAGVSLAALAETKALLAAAAPTDIDPADLRLVAIGDPLVFADSDGTRSAIARATVMTVMAQQDEARQTLATRRARRRRHIGNARKAGETFLAAFSELLYLKGLDADFAADIAAARAAIDAGQFTRTQTLAMARLARRPQAHQFDRARSFDLFEAMTGISLSQTLETAKARTGLPVLAALWYAYADLPDKARRPNGLSLEAIEADTRPAIFGSFSAGDTAADPDQVTLSFGAIESTSFAHVLRHELAHALHDNNLDAIDAWLTEQFGWQVFDIRAAARTGIASAHAADDGWITALGGWAVAAPAAVSETDRTTLRATIIRACQPSDKLRAGKAMSRWQDDMADSRGWFGESLPQQVYVRSPDDWWKHADTWLAVPGRPDYRTFMCHQYRQLAIVDVRAIDLVTSGAVPFPYALMSQKEFFAELYACWHWPRGSRKSPRRLVRAHVPEMGELLKSL